MKRVKRIEWNNVSLVVDVAITFVAISRVLIHREYARLHQGSLASLAHLAHLLQRDEASAAEAVLRIELD